MITIALSREHMGTRAQLHGYLQRELGFPDHYGHNLDALHDCLTDISRPTAIELPLSIQDEDEGLGTYGRSVIRVFRSAARANRHLRLVLK